MIRRAWPLCRPFLCVPWRCTCRAFRPRRQRCAPHACPSLTSLDRDFVVLVVIVVIVIVRRFMLALSFGLTRRDVRGEWRHNVVAAFDGCPSESARPYIVDRPD